MQACLLIGVQAKMLSSETASIICFVAFPLRINEGNPSGVTKQMKVVLKEDLTAKDAMKTLSSQRIEMLYFNSLRSLRKT
jgi:hypothetical protein